MVHTGAMTTDDDSVLQLAGYSDLLARLKDRVRQTQFRAARAANTEVMRLYWSIGREILDRQSVDGVGARDAVLLLGEDEMGVKLTK